GVPPAAQAGGMAVAPFRGIERSYFDLRWHLDPVGATQAGVKTYDDRYGRFSPSALAPHLAALKSLAAALEETTAPELDDENDRTALLNEIRVPVRVFVETARRVNEGELSVVREVAAGLGERVAAAADAAAVAMAAFAHDLERWLEGASDQFAVGEDDFNFHLPYAHALRDTAPE